jgi:NAD(P)-dependent dehydrogenase (short-subunit alcohol dehydrogenase family)
VTARIDLSGRVVLVTEGARGIGYASAKRAVACGALVAICDLNTSDVQEACNELGPDALAVTADVSREGDCETAVASVLARFGRIDALVNNAGIFENLRGTLKQELSDWRRVIDVNLQGPFLMSRAVARAMVASGSGGSIVNICSVAGLVGFRASNAYGVSKAAVAMLTQTMATDLARHGVRVNAVAPGFVHSAMTAALPNSIGVATAEFERRIPMGRYGDPD